MRDANRIRRAARRDTLAACGVTAGLIVLGATRTVEPDSCYALALIGGIASFAFGAVWVESAAACGSRIGRRLDRIRRDIAHED